jgi:hypothetical protein
VTRSIPISQLASELDAITNDETEAVFILAVSSTQINARAYGDKALIIAALDEIDFETAQPMREAYAH